MLTIEVTWPIPCFGYDKTNVEEDVRWREAPGYEDELTVSGGLASADYLLFNQGVFKDALSNI